MQAKIYEGTSLGEYCKVGGEVEESIFQAYSNKQHDGFLGHAFLGEWVNLGADTSNSDLKNNYSTVTVTINGNQVESGSQFVGAIMGDHCKSGINTMFNTGTVIGVGCSVYGADFPPKYIPSFCWGGAVGLPCLVRRSEWPCAQMRHTNRTRSASEGPAYVGTAAIWPSLALRVRMPAPSRTRSFSAPSAID